MNAKAVLHVLAWLVGGVGLLMGLCGAVSWGYGERAAARALWLAGGGAAALGAAAGALTRGGGMLSPRDGIGVVAFGWLAAGLAGAVPFLLAGTIGDFPSAFFESMSGFTTSGATVLACVEVCPKGLLLWRALMQAIGGGGVLLLVMVFLPFTGAGGMQLFRAETTGPLKDRTEPRMASSAKMIWMCYGILAGVLLVLLRFGGMTWFESVCHALTTVATGGFSTRTASIAGFGSVYIEIVIGVFMLLSGLNFACYVRALHGDFRPLWRSEQNRAYLGLFALAVAGCAGALWGLAGTGAGQALRDGFFTCASVMTSTGFCTADFARWPAVGQGILLVLMCVGGCAGSTAGGLKVVRGWVSLRALARAVRGFFQPRVVLPLRMDGKPLGDELVVGVLAFVALFFLLALLGTLAMLLFVPDGKTAFSTVVSALGNTGPALGKVGIGNYAAVPAGGKFLLAFLMLAGRLELYTVLAVFMPAFWRR